MPSRFSTGILPARFSKGAWPLRLPLYPEDFSPVWRPLPPLAEQPAIVRHIEAETGKRDIALIAAAVTGKIDVANRIKAKPDR